MVEFVRLSRQEAKAFLLRFEGETPERLQQLRDQVTVAGGPEADALDLTPASLDPLWRWAAPQLSWRDGYVPPPPGEPGTPVDLDGIGPEDELPSWFDPHVPGWARWSATSLWLIDGVARYLGETLVAQVPGARWAVGHSRTRGYVYQNHPVVTGLPLDEAQPMASVAIIASRVLLPTPGPRTPRDLYDAWT